jgi:nucleosome binding factor SPN SPT16 subunit
LFQSDEDKSNFQKLIDALKRSKQGKTLGVFSKDNYPGQFMDAWRAVLKKEHFETVS